MGTLMTSEVILHIIENLCPNNVSIYINFYQNPFLNELPNKNFI